MSATAAQRMHQFIARESGEVITERLFGDRIIRFLYSAARERAPALFRAATSRMGSDLLALFLFDLPVAPRLLGNRRFLRRAAVDLDECLDDAASFTTPRRIFERRIRYWERRPMPGGSDIVVSPADARVVIGSLRSSSGFYLKGAFFELWELLGIGRDRWEPAFRECDYAIFRLTPEKYHYNHVPAAGVVVDHYEVPGDYHSCNPSAVVELATPYSKNRRAITVIDTDVPGGSWVGRVIMVEVVALMVGAVVQCYSETAYDDPRPVTPGMFLRTGAPKSLYRPGSSTDLLLFEPNRVEFAEDLRRHTARGAVESRFSAAFGRPIVETEVRVRSLIARRAPIREVPAPCPFSPPSR